MQERELRRDFRLKAEIKGTPHRGKEGFLRKEN